MNSDFRNLVENMHPSFEKLISMEPYRNGDLPKSMPSKGVYLFSEGEQHLYVGRSNSLRKRYQQHTRPSAPHNQAVFAFKIARMNTGNTVASYKPGLGSREGLLKNPQFYEQFPFLPE